MFKIYFREGAKILEEQRKPKGLETYQHQILGVGPFADPQFQALYDELILSWCHKAAFNAWDRIQELGIKFESYTRVIQGQRETVPDFLLIKTLQVIVRDPEARCVLIEFLAFENATLEYKRIHGLLKFRSAPIDEWILHTMNTETLDYNTVSWVGEAISKVMRKHQNAIFLIVLE